MYNHRVEGYHSHSLANSMMMIRDDKEANVWLKLLSDTVEVQQEIEVYDFTSIVGSVGGSLGLFVGFSFLQCLLSLYRRAEMNKILN